jgi:hypothetical protein
MIIESGVIIFIGFLLLMIKLPNWQLAWLLGHPLKVDLAASVLAYVLHFGTFTGAMAAAVAGLMASAMTTIGRRLIGYTTKNAEGKYEYTAGVYDIFAEQDRENEPNS